jgi:hypothetical protein
MSAIARTRRAVDVCHRPKELSSSDLLAVIPVFRHADTRSLRLKNSSGVAGQISSFGIV